MMRISLLPVLTLVFWVAGFGQQGAASGYQGKVLSVTGGNSLVIQIDNHKISVTLIGTDAVEKKYPTAAEARAQLTSLLKNSPVTFVPVEQFDLAKDNSAAGKILIGNQDAGLSQLQAGFAVIPAGETKLTPEDKNLYKEAERAAAQLRKGLWSADLICQDSSTNGVAELPAPSTLKSATAKIRISGTVIVRVTISEFGDVIEAKALCGNPYLRAKSVEAAMKSKFKPTVFGGQAVSVTGNIIYKFEAN